ncbi:MAG TPA: molybdopterin-dependent oxidoreductase [Actinomycetota bacterium]
MTATTEGPTETTHAAGVAKAAVAGLAGTAAATILSALLHTFWSAVPFAPVAIAQVLIRAPSGAVDSFFIDRLGHWAQRIAVFGTSVGFALSGAGLGAVAARARTRVGVRAVLTIALLPLWVASFLLYPVTPQHLTRAPFALVTLPVWIAAGWFAGHVYAGLTGPSQTRRVDHTRRVAIKAIGFGGAGVLVGLANLGRLVYRRPDPGREKFTGAYEAARGPKQAAGDAAFDDVPGLTREVTSNTAHYVVDEEIIDPDIDPETWRLSVTGLVDRPLSLTYDEVRAFPLVERFHTLQCISNEINGHLIGTAKWIGVPLPLILERAGIQPGAVEVVFRASGGYSDSHSVEVAMDDSSLIALGMNGRVLPRAHGFPARLLTLGTYGIKNPKWLTEIEVVDEPYEGFWEQRGWSKPAIVKTGARIDVPKNGADEGATVTAAGIAFAGARGISRVEVSTDGGTTWNEAQLKTPLADHTWRLWMHRWTVGPADLGPLYARAYDGDGVRQAAAVMDPYPSGASGYPSVDL